MRDTSGFIGTLPYFDRFVVIVQERDPPISLLEVGGVLIPRLVIVTRGGGGSMMVALGTVELERRQIAAHGGVAKERSVEHLTPRGAVVGSQQALVGAALGIDAVHLIQ